MKSVFMSFVRQVKFVMWITEICFLKSQYWFLRPFMEKKDDVNSEFAFDLISFVDICNRLWTK